MDNQPFYYRGLLFSCVRCSSCCRKESGFVYLSENDLSRLANGHGMDYTAFINTWCRWVPWGRGRERLSLREKSNYDCIFWDNGCTVYGERPLQCRAFPFWDSVICSEQAWNATGQSCPGINSGDCHEMDKIESFISQMTDEAVIERKTIRLGEN